MADDPEAAATDETEEGLTPSKVDFKAVARVAKNSVLRQVNLLSCDTERPLPHGAFTEGWTSDAYVGFRSGATPVQEDGWFAVVVGFLCQYKPGWDPDAGAPDVSQDDPPALHLEAAFELIYDLEDEVELDERELEHFAYANGTHNAWPYWRELAQSVTVRMGLEPLVVGPFKIPSSFDPR